MRFFDAHEVKIRIYFRFLFQLFLLSFGKVFEQMITRNTFIPIEDPERQLIELCPYVHTNS